VPANPTLFDINTNRHERSTELHVQDQIMLSPRWSLWAGARHTRLERQSAITDGSNATAYAQSLTTPWLALSWALDARTLAYASSGQGLESEVTPNRTIYSNPGQVLPALKSRQIELGVKHSGDTLDWRIAAFDIRRPTAADFHSDDGAPAFGDCTDADPCLRRSDGVARHRGIEADTEWRAGALSLRASALLLRARREGSASAAVNGLRPANVPARSAKLQAAYNVAAVPGLALTAFVTHEGPRAVLPDNAVKTPGWTRIDVGGRWTHRMSAQTLTWRIGIDNVADRRAWQEAPYQFGHAYLYPLQARTLHASLAAAW
jgi:iron complex outermembrane recepter protein